VLTETWLVPIEGWFVDKFGPKIVVLIGGILVGIAWVLNSLADSLGMLYLGAAIGGIGAGAIYGTCVGNALKWFPDRRGLAAGLTAAGFGAGSALTIIPIQEMIASKGYQAAFFNFGIGQAVVVILVSFVLAAPFAGEVKAVAARVLQTTRDYAPVEMLGSPVFWVLYVMFVLVGAGGLMATAQLAPIAKDFKIDTVPVTLIGLTLPALTFALSIDRILNGVTRPFFGWVSDHIGRENTMLIAFGIEAVGIWMLGMLGHDPVMFVILSGLVFFAWGEIYSLFPSTCTDAFGTKYATTNAGLLYTAKGTASLLVPFGNVLAAATGSWKSVFLVAAVMNALAALAAPFVLRPMRAAHAARAARLEAGSAASAAE
jgi:OFA family oxalate/formate antiporter-like MFS transporter